MKRVIRRGVFETNSSSTHTICIPKQIGELNLPKSIQLVDDEFGWEFNLHDSPQTKLSYLCVGLKENEMVDELERVKTIIEKAGVKIIDRDANISGYLDHSSGLMPFLTAIMKDDGMLLRYIFSDLSFVSTGNDNDKTVQPMGTKLDGMDYDNFYKGN